MGQENNSGAQPVALSSIAYALAAHVVWGSMPIYLLLVTSVPSLEFVAWRLVFTLPLCLVLLSFLFDFKEMKSVLKNKHTMLVLMGSSLTIGANWLLYVYSIQSGYVYAASLGYYILPLTMMLLGMIFLKERLTRPQWVAVALAAIGVAALSAGALTTMWLSLSMAITFGIYGLLRKTVAAGSLVGLTVETLLLMPIALAIIAFYAVSSEGSAINQGWDVALAIGFSGPMTAVPLLLFAVAARRMPYTLIGFLQFSSPTIVFLLGMYLFGEELKPAQLVCFILIWSAAALFCWDLFRRKDQAASS